jgi:hypothetical protein
MEDTTVGLPRSHYFYSTAQKIDYFKIGTVLEELKILLMRMGTGTAPEPHRYAIDFL